MIQSSCSQCPLEAEAWFCYGSIRRRPTLTGQEQTLWQFAERLMFLMFARQAWILVAALVGARHTNARLSDETP